MLIGGASCARFGINTDKLDVHKQEIMTQADVEAELLEKRALASEKRTAERHAQRMAWYRSQGARQALNILYTGLAFAAVTFVLVRFDWWTGITAGAFAAGTLILLLSFNSASSPPEDRN